MGTVFWLRRRRDAVGADGAALAAGELLQLEEGAVDGIERDAEELVPTAENELALPQRSEFPRTSKVTSEPRAARPGGRLPARLLDERLRPAKFVKSANWLGMEPRRFGHVEIPRPESFARRPISEGNPPATEWPERESRTRFDREPRWVGRLPNRPGLLPVVGLDHKICCSEVRPVTQLPSEPLIPLLVIESEVNSESRPSADESVPLQLPDSESAVTRPRESQSAPCQPAFPVDEHASSVDSQEQAGLSSMGGTTTVPEREEGAAKPARMESIAAESAAAVWMHVVPSSVVFTPALRAEERSVGGVPHTFVSPVTSSVDRLGRGEEGEGMEPRK